MGDDNTVRRAGGVSSIGTAGPVRPGAAAPLTDAGFRCRGLLLTEQPPEPDNRLVSRVQPIQLPDRVRPASACRIGELDLTAEEYRAPTILADRRQQPLVLRRLGARLVAGLVYRERPVRGLRCGGRVRQPAGDRDANARYGAEPSYVATVPAAERAGMGRHERVGWKPRPRRGRDRSCGSPPRTLPASPPTLRRLSTWTTALRRCRCQARPMRRRLRARST